MQLIHRRLLASRSSFFQDNASFSILISTHVRYSHTAHAIEIVRHFFAKNWIANANGGRGDAVQMMGLEAGPMRMPLTEMEDKNKARLEAELKAYGLLRGVHHDNL